MPPSASTFFHVSPAKWKIKLVWPYCHKFVLITKLKKIISCDGTNDDFIGWILKPRFCKRDIVEYMLSQHSRYVSPVIYINHWCKTLFSRPAKWRFWCLVQYPHGIYIPTRHHNINWYALINHMNVLFINGYCIKSILYVKQY